METAAARKSHRLPGRMSGNLEQLLEDGVIDEVLSRLKSGKEADVWLVRHREEVLAAKVYKERSLRSFKNNSGYKEGRTVRNTRTQRAMDRGSSFGQEAAEEAWKSAESDALHKLHARGVRVPAPVLFYEGILLMKLVLDTEGHPAPRLIDVAFEPAAAAQAYADLRAQAVRMLCSDLIHGDLSAYNVLLGAEGPTLIDFPQVISAAQNSTAAEFFKRDIENLRTFFAGFDPALAARTGDAPEIWQAYVRRELTPEFVPSGRPVREPEPRARQGGARQHSETPGHGGAHRQGGPHRQGGAATHGGESRQGGAPGSGGTQRHAGVPRRGGASGAQPAHPRGPQQSRPTQGGRGHQPGPQAPAPRGAPTQGRILDGAQGRPRHGAQAHDSRGQVAHGGHPQQRHDSRGQVTHGGHPQQRHDSRGQGAPGGQQPRHGSHGLPGSQKGPGGSRPPPARHSQGAPEKSSRPHQTRRPVPVVERVHRPAPQGGQHPPHASPPGARSPRR